MSVFTLTPTGLPSRAYNLTGEAYGEWKVLGFAGYDRFGYTRWNCECSCGTVRAVSGKHLRRGSTQSCGCRNRRATVEERREMAAASPVPVYLNGTPARSVTATPDQPSARARLKRIAAQLRPGADPAASSLRPGHGKGDALARACALLALRTPTEEQLWDLRFALEFAGLNTLADSVWEVVQGMADAGTLNEVRRLLAEALSK